MGAVWASASAWSGLIRPAVNAAAVAANSGSVSATASWVWRAACPPDSLAAVRSSRLACSAPVAVSSARPATAATQRSRSAVTCAAARVKLSTSARSLAWSMTLRSRAASRSQAVINR